MTKTLRVRTRTGWTTKPAPDLDENRLTAEEIDDNFLALDTEKASLHIGATAPSPATDFWWDTTDGNLYVYYDDGDTVQYVPATVTGGGSSGVQSDDFTTISKVTEMPAEPDANTLYIVVEESP